MRKKVVAGIITLIGIGGASLTRANWVASRLGFLSLPEDVRGALIIMSHAPMFVTYLFLIVGIGGLIGLIYEYGLYRALLQWARKATSRTDRALARDDISLRLAETERGIAQNKAGLEGLQLEVAMLTRSLRARDAEAMIKGADQVIMCTAKKILEEPYPDEAAWVADYAVWETSMTQIDNLMSQWQPHDKLFLDIRPKDLEGAPAPPPQSSIRFVTNIMGYQKVWLAQQRYAHRREGILKYLFSKAGELPG